MRQISDEIALPVTANQFRRLRRIDAEDYDGAAEQAAKELRQKGVRPTGDYLQRGIYALKQYYAVALLDPANAHAISAPIDPFWHGHILHTEQYVAFCTDVVGEYMHHIPLNHGNGDQVSNVRDLYGYTLEVLPRLFDGIDPAFWPPRVTNEDLICFHKGNRDIYPALQGDRLFEPCPRGHAWAYA